MNHGVDRKTLLAAADLAQRQSVSPEAALLGEGLVPEKAFYVALADWLNVPYYTGSPEPDTTTEVAAAIQAGFAAMANPERSRRRSRRAAPR